ncbi:MAG: polyphosphate kinase 1 [Lachnospiraceae bacterium]|nr:polyphosphate kinase 1 [Lachnospiraceae bacterium]
MDRAGFDNRELSWLKFNERVLEEAEDDMLPLCERLFFLSVFESNQDEFFMVRVGALYDRQALAEDIRENKTKMTPSEQLEAVGRQVRRLGKRRDGVYRKLQRDLASQGVCLTGFDGLSPENKKALKEYFLREICPILSPQVVGKRQPFPFLGGGALYVVLYLETRNGNARLGVIPCFSRFFPRLLACPGYKDRYLLAEEVILHFAPIIFANYRVKGGAVIRITRNADMDPDGEYEGEDYRDVMEELVRRRMRRQPVRLELSKTLPDPALSLLCHYLRIDRKRIYCCPTPMDLSFLEEVRHMLRGRTELFYRRFLPRRGLMAGEAESIRRQAETNDIMLSFPYEDMKPFLQMLREAAADPEVISVKMTLYRLAKDSKIADILMEAAENGKEVLVLLELGARFDEENNIEWSRRLEEAGCRIFYGLDGLKIHCKLCLITAKRKGTLSFLTQIGTGNYNERTARQYTDLCYITSDRKLGEEAGRIFHALSLGQVPGDCENMVAAPRRLQERILGLIKEQIQEAQAGRPAYIGMKMNSLTDKRVICALMEASSSGVAVELIVRGACCIVGGIAGKTEHVRVISIVGRFLEHSRIYLFGVGEGRRAYIGSADMMTRNTLRRVEALAPVQDRACKERLEQMFAILWADEYNSWLQQPDGSYVRKSPGGRETAFDAQDYFCRMAEDRREARLPQGCRKSLCLSGRVSAVEPS